MARTRAAWSRLSIGAKLALRYALAASFTISVFAGIVYSEVSRRINREATLLLETQARDLVDAFQSQSREHPREHVLAWFQAHIQQMLRHADPELSLGVELLDAEGGVVLAAGSLAGGRLPPPAPGARLDPLRVRAVNLGGEFAHLVAAAPVDAGVLRMAIGTHRYAENVRHFRGVFALALPIVFALTGVVGWLLAQRSLRPLQEINRSARRIGAATLDEQIPTTGTGDELDQLASTLNEMTSRIRGGVERMRRFTANAAHQLRTPVTAIRNQIEVTLEQERGAGEYQRVLEDVLRESQRMSEGITAMLQLARSEAGLDPARLAPHSIRKILEDVIEFFAPLAQEQGIELRAGTVADAQVVGDASWLVQLFSNLVANGIQYTPAGGRVEVTAQAGDRQIEVRVQDSGPGIPEEQRGRVFERFQRGPNGQTGPGFGLGLAIAQEIARSHRGGIRVESRPGAGASFVVELPIAAEPARR
jgi:signal transduction histidine kinase